MQSKIAYIVILEQVTIMIGWSNQFDQSLVQQIRL